MSCFKYISPDNIKTLCGAFILSRPFHEISLAHGDRGQKFVAYFFLWGWGRGFMTLVGGGQKVSNFIVTYFVNRPCRIVGFIRRWTHNVGVRKIRNRMRVYMDTTQLSSTPPNELRRYSVDLHGRVYETIKFYWRNSSRIKRLSLRGSVRLFGFLLRNNQLLVFFESYQV